MNRKILAYIVFSAVFVSGPASTQAQPPWGTPLSPALRNRVDDAFELLANPTLGKEAKSEKVRSVIIELQLQRDLVEKKQQRFAHRMETLLGQLDELWVEEQKQREAIGLSSASKETLETLLRNSELEMQRLRWQSAAEETPGDPKVVEIRERLAMSRMEDINAQIMDTERQVELQSKKLDSIEVLMKAGQVPSSELIEQQSRIAEIQSVLNAARRRREEVALQVEIEQATELEKSKLNRVRLQRKDDMLRKEVMDLSHGLKQLSDLERRRIFREVCEDRIREYDHALGEIEVQKSELDVLIEFLKEATDSAE